MLAGMERGDSVEDWARLEFDPAGAINTSILEYVLMYLLLVRPCIKYCAIIILKSRKNILQYILFTIYYTA